MIPESPKLAVVGGGVAGVVAAHYLQDRYRVTLFEKNRSLGGHTHTVTITEGADAGLPVDTGFIVLNDRTYPLFTDFLRQLGVDTRPTGMSFSVHSPEDGFTYSSRTMNSLFARRINLIRPAFWSMLSDILRFFREANRFLQQDQPETLTLGRFLEDGGYRTPFVRNYLVPMTAAIWSAAAGDVLKFPAGPLFRFFDNHGLLSLVDRPQWRTVVGGSRRYMDAFQERFQGTVRLGSAVRDIHREGEEVLLRLTDGHQEIFQVVVVACHADDALRLLRVPTDDEKRLLGPWRYQENHTVLHTDTSALPPQRRAWACWNYCRESGEGGRPVSVTYYMNMLQGLTCRRHYCVSLNRQTPPEPGTVIAEMVYRHPTYTVESMRTQKELPSLNGVQNTFYCGSYFGYGFHEDAVRSAVAVARRLGARL